MPSVSDSERIAQQAKDAASDIIDDIVEITRDDAGGISGTVKRIVKDLSGAPAPKQLAVGAAAGWTAGYMAMKVGKMAATVVGGSLLLLQIAHHNGYIKVNWNRVTGDSSDLADRVKEKFRINTRSGFQKFQDFAAENVYLAGGFTGGFFLGISCS